MPQGIDLAVIGLNLLAGAGLVAMLGVLTWLSWGVVRSTTTPQHDSLRGLTRRLVPALWAGLGVFITTGIFGEVNNNSASLELPNAWEFAIAGEDRAYALIALGAYLFMAQVILGLSALTWGGSKGALGSRTRAGRSHDRASDLGAALISTLSLTATLFAVIAMSVVGYLQGLAHTLK